MAGVETSRLDPDLPVLSAPPPVDGYRYATAILDPAGRYLLVNQSFAGLHGATPDELRGRAEHDLVARAVATELGENDRLALTAPAATVGVERVIDSVGRRRVVMCRCALLDDHGRPRAVCRMYASTSARDRVLAEFRKLLDALDPTGARTRLLDAVLLGKDAPPPAPVASAPPAAVPVGADPVARAAPDETVAERRRTEGLLADERAARQRLDADHRQERAAAGERDRLSRVRAGELEAELGAERATRLALEQGAAASLDEARSALEETRRMLEDTRGALEDTRRALEETRGALEDERSTRESLTAEVGVASAAQTAIESHAAELQTRLAAERTARRQAEARTRAVEARHLGAEQARTQAQARLAALESGQAADRSARDQAETRVRELEAERAAAREALENLRRRLDADAPDTDARPAPAAVPTPAAGSRPAAPTRRLPEASRLAEPSRLPEARRPPAQEAPPPPSPVSAPAPGPTQAPRRARSETVHRPARVPVDATFPALAAALRSPTGPGRSLRTVLPLALTVIGEESAWDAVTMWHRSESRRPLTCLGIWTRPGIDLGWFESISWRGKLVVGEPPAGDLDPAGRLTWIADLGGDGGSVRERTARSAGLATRVLVPLTDGQAIAGAVETYARTSRVTDNAAIDRLTAAASLLTPLLLRDTHEAEQRRWRV